MKIYGPKHDPNLSKSVYEVAPGHFISNMLQKGYGAPRAPAKLAPLTRAAAPAPAPTPAPRMATAADVPLHVRQEIEHAAIKRYKERLYARGADANVPWNQLQQMLG